MRHFVFVVERALLMMPEGVEQVCVILDFTNFSLFNNPSLSMTMDVLHILTNHYPERLGLAMLFNPHWLFWSVAAAAAVAVPIAIPLPRRD